MGEKGNISSDELVAAGSGAIIAGAGTQVMAVFEEAADALKDKVLDKGADAGLAVASEQWQQRRGTAGSADPTDPPSPS